MISSLIIAKDALMPWSGFATGFCCVVAVHTFNQEQYLRSEVHTYLTGAGVLGITLWWYLPERSAALCYEWLGCFTLGLICVYYFYRLTPGLLDNAKAFLTKRSVLERLVRTDVRTIADQFSKNHEEYDPRQYHRVGEFFMGLNKHNKPIYWQGKLPHCSVVGTSGCGKGKKLQDLAAQCIMNGESVFYLDPKDDEWGPHALYSACVEHGKPYHYISLLPEAPFQFNILAGAKAWEIEELFSATLSLSNTGKGSDHFKAKDRNAAHHAAILAFAENLTIAELYTRMSSDTYWKNEATGFLDGIREMAGVHAINAKQSNFSLADVVKNGGGVYVVGSMTLQSVKRAQQMVFVRIQQIATARDRMAGELRTVCVIADEMKYHISKPVLQGLGASRDKGMRVILAFQSFADLKDCPADMNAEMVVGAIVANTRCKLVYQIEDPDTADWLARKSGITLVDDETRQVDLNIALAESADSTRSIRQGEDFLFDTNKWGYLPPGVAVLFGDGLPKTCYISTYRVDKSTAAITPTAAPNNDNEENSDASESDKAKNNSTQSEAGTKQQGHNDFFSLD